MKTSDNPWQKSSFVKRDHVVHKPHRGRRPLKRLSGILRAETVRYSPEPVELGEKTSKIQLEPVVVDGQVKALRVSCTCGCQSTFDIQYAAGGTQA